MRAAIAALLALSVCSCRFIDFGGDDEKPFEFRPFWGQGPDIGEENPETPGYDKDGNKIPPPEVLATYTFPDIFAGVRAVIGPEPRVTPTVGIELFEVKVPYARWFSAQLSAGDQLMEFSFHKRITSIYEITIGPFVGWDFDEHDVAWGIGGSIIKF